MIEDNSKSIPDNKPQVSLENNSKPIIGKIAETIGTGENAKTTIIYLVLRWAFTAFTIITVLVTVNCWIFRDGANTVPDLTNDIKAIWGVATPIITLALGYAFGKSER